MQDIDECATGGDNCDADFGICINTPGAFQCVCTAGLLLRRVTNTCIGSTLLRKHPVDFSQKFTSNFIVVFLDPDEILQIPINAVFNDELNDRTNPASQQFARDFEDEASTFIDFNHDLTHFLFEPLRDPFS